MNFDKKTIIAFILIGLVLLLVQSPLYKKAFYAEFGQERLETASDSLYFPVDGTKVAEQPAISARKDTIPERVHEIYEKSILQTAQQDFQEPVYQIENAFYSGKISSKGAVVKQWNLKTYDGPDGKPVELLPEDSQNTLAISFLTKEGDTLNTSDFGFTAQNVKAINATNKEQTLRFILEMENNRRIIKEYTFYPDRYDIGLKVTLENMDDLIAEKKYFVQASDGMASTESRLNDDMYYAKAGVKAGKEVDKGYKANRKTYEETGDIDWVAVRTKYFTIAIVPESRKGSSASVYGDEIKLNSSDNSKWKKYEITLTMPIFSSELVKDDFMVYLGPLDIDIVKQYKIDLQELMDFGFIVIQPFSQAILWSFKKLHTFIPNYGLVLIVFSILIKIIVYPLTHKSYESMKKMQGLQPKLQEIKEKYGKDAQRLNKETMKLYKSEGVNPAGGCLPMLLQMPLLWGLFIVFRSTIELRGANFMLWIKDLSSPDTVATLPFSIPMYGNTVNILPLFMGATMLIQQKMSTTDPKQKMLVYFMPIFLTLLFNQFPSGLNLYYALFNLFSIIQQKWLVDFHKKKKQEPVIKKKI